MKKIFQRRDDFNINMSLAEAYKIEREIKEDLDAYER